MVKKEMWLKDKPEELTAYKAVRIELIEGVKRLVPPFCFGEVGFYYKIRGIIFDEAVDYREDQVREERFIETTINPQENKKAALDLINIKMLNITELHKKFFVDLDIV